MSPYPFFDPSCNAVQPLLLGIPASAPLSSRNWTSHGSCPLVQKRSTHLRDLSVAAGYGPVQGSLSSLVDNVELGHPRYEDLQTSSSGLKDFRALYFGHRETAFAGSSMQRGVAISVDGIDVCSTEKKNLREEPFSPLRVSRETSAVWKCPFSTATCNGLFPSASTAWMSAPASTRTFKGWRRTDERRASSGRRSPRCTSRIRWQRSGATRSSPQTDPGFPLRLYGGIRNQVRDLIATRLGPLGRRPVSLPSSFSGGMASDDVAHE